jgi:hypothetical protein
MKNIFIDIGIIENTNPQFVKDCYSYGDYAIASPRKFFPIFDSGCLVSTQHSLDAVYLDGAAFRSKQL